MGLLSMLFFFLPMNGLWFLSIYYRPAPLPEWAKSYFESSYISFASVEDRELRKEVEEGYQQCKGAYTVLNELPQSSSQILVSFLFAVVLIISGFQEHKNYAYLFVNIGVACASLVVPCIVLTLKKRNSTREFLLTHDPYSESGSNLVAYHTSVMHYFKSWVRYSEKRRSLMYLCYILAGLSIAGQYASVTIIEKIGLF